CIVGPSGCGKSTLLMVAAGLVTPSEGEVLVDGKPATAPGADRGMVFQSYSLYPWLSVRRNIEFGMEIKRTPRTERKLRSGELIHVWTNRPGRIRTTLRVDLPRPRTFDMVGGPHFAQLRNQVVGIIHEESLKAVESELARA